jgi:hypothetical protein
LRGEENEFESTKQTFVRNDPESFVVVMRILTRPFELEAAWKSQYDRVASKFAGRLALGHDFGSEKSVGDLSLVVRTG